MEEFLKSISALNDETRVLILKFLLVNGKCCVCELESSLEMTQSRLSRHLKILKDAGFLSVIREGTWAYYYIKERSEIQKNLLNEIKSLNLNLPKKINACEIKEIKGKKCS